MKRALVALAVALVACGGGPEAVAPGRTVSLHLRGAPGGASVTIDDQYIGTLEMVAAHGVALPPGQHRLTVTAPGHFPDDRLVTAPDAEHPRPIELEVRLTPIPD